MWQVDKLYLSRDENGYHHLQARTSGPSQQEALQGAEHIYSLFDGKKRFVRRLPEATSETDFETGVTEHRGFVRFSYIDEPGETTVISNVGPPMMFGEF